MEKLETDLCVSESDLQQIKEKYPDSRIFQEEFKRGGVPVKVRAFLYSKRYKDFDVKFYANFTSGASLGANIYSKDEFQYSISTNSGEFKNKLEYLEQIVGSIDKKGFSSVRSKFNSGNLNMSFDKF